MITASYLDPLSYGVDALRGTLLGASASPIYTDIAVLLGFAGATMFIGTASFSRMK